MQRGYLLTYLLVALITCVEAPLNINLHSNKQKQLLLDGRDPRTNWHRSKLVFVSCDRRSQVRDYCKLSPDLLDPSCSTDDADDIQTSDRIFNIVTVLFVFYRRLKLQTLSIIAIFLKIISGSTSLCAR